MASRTHQKFNYTAVLATVTGANPAYGFQLFRGDRLVREEVTPISSAHGISKHRLRLDLAVAALTDAISTATTISPFRLRRPKVLVLTACSDLLVAAGVKKVAPVAYAQHRADLALEKLTALSSAGYRFSLASDGKKVAAFVHSFADPYDDTRSALPLEAVQDATARAATAQPRRLRRRRTDTVTSPAEVPNTSPAAAQCAVVVACDGSYDHLRKIGVWSWSQDSGPTATGFTPANATSSIACEITAAVNAITDHSGADLLLLSDCRAVVTAVRALTADGHLPDWKVVRDGVHAEHWQKLASAVSKHRQAGDVLHANWVQGHTGHLLQTRPDLASRSALRARRIALSTD